MVYNNVISEDEHIMVHKIHFYFYKYYIIHSTLKTTAEVAVAGEIQMTKPVQEQQ